MKIGLAGPVSTDNIARFLDGDTSRLPSGYAGAPLFGTLISGLLQRGHSVTVYTTSTDLFKSDCKPVVAAGKRFKITYCPARPRSFRYENGHWGRAVDAFRLERNYLRQAMLEDSPDLIHAHWTYEFALAALDAGLPHLITCHDAPQAVLRHMPNAYRLARYFMARRVLSRAMRLSAVSPYAKEMVEGFARVPVTVIPNPLPDTLDFSNRGTRQFDSGQPRVAMVLNGWGKLKNPQAALRAFALLRRSIPHAELTAFGADFGAGEQAQRWADTAKLSTGVVFRGRVTHDTLLKELADHDVLLHPSLLEACPMAVIEAMALGLPVVGGDTSGGVPWVIGKGGVLADVRNPVSICDALRAVLADSKLNAQLSADARENTLRRFSADVISAQYEAEYQCAISGY